MASLRILIAAGMAVTLLAMAGCGGQKPKPAAATTVSFNLSYNKYSASNERLGETAFEDGLQLLFRVIPGAILGKPPEAILVTENPHDGQLHLTLPANAERYAQPLQAESLVVTPADTKVVRLASYHSYPHYSEPAGSGGFVDRNSGNPLVLVYFSQPVTISGILELDQQTLVHELEIPSAGWHWLELVSDQPEQVVIKRYFGREADIEFRIIAENIISL
ncbi:hypothetical protein [Halioxenophilus sp. WMMB6]|uniref:hypothetical protein n=1 Tax=Halioxenophilus sp. WMMB6 TaxID=3073815 RepID=UPI00295F58E0|nr:hypothetical protein [Halioxenophilus sp. WMMB6]